MGLTRLASLVAGSWWCGEVAFPELLAVSACGRHGIAVDSVTLAADKAPQPAGLEPGPPALISPSCQQVPANVQTAVFLRPPLAHILGSRLPVYGHCWTPRGDPREPAPRAGRRRGGGFLRHFPQESAQAGLHTGARDPNPYEGDWHRAVQPLSPPLAAPAGLHNLAASRPRPLQEGCQSLPE